MYNKKDELFAKMFELLDERTTNTNKQIDILQKQNNYLFGAILILLVGMLILFYSNNNEKKVDNFDNKKEISYIISISNKELILT